MLTSPTQPTMKQYKINNKLIMANSMGEAWKHYSFLDRAVRVKVKMPERSIVLYIVMKDTSEYLEDAMKYAVLARLEELKFDIDMFHVYDSEGCWITSSEL